MWTNGQTDVMKLLLAFCNSANTPKNCRVYLDHSQKMTSGYPLCLEGSFEVVCGFQ